MSHVRCSFCRARRTLRRHPDSYYVVPKCRVCNAWRKRGGQRWYIDRWRMAHEVGKGARTRTCYPGRGGCNSYHHPHRRGGGWCEHNAKLTAEDFSQRVMRL